MTLSCRFAGRCDRSTAPRATAVWPALTTTAPGLTTAWVSQWQRQPHLLMLSQAGSIVYYIYNKYVAVIMSSYTAITVKAALTTTALGSTTALGELAASASSPNAVTGWIKDLLYTCIQQVVVIMSSYTAVTVEPALTTTALGLTTAWVSLLAASTSSPNGVCQ